MYKNKNRDKEEDGGHVVTFPNSSTVVGESSKLPMMQKLNSNMPAQSPTLLHHSQAMHATSSQMSTYNNGQNDFQMPANMLHSHGMQATSSHLPIYYSGQNFLLPNGGHGDSLWQQNNSHHHADFEFNNQPEEIHMINNVPNEDTFWCGFLSSDNGDYSEPIDFGGVPSLDYMKSD